MVNDNSLLQPKVTLLGNQTASVKKKWHKNVNNQHFVEKFVIFVTINVMVA